MKQSRFLAMQEVILTLLLSCIINTKKGQNKHQHSVSLSELREDMTVLVVIISMLFL